MDKRIIHIDYYKTSFGELILGDFEGKLCLADWRYRKMREQIDKRIQSNLNADYFEKETPVLVETKKQLELYFSGELTQFDIPLLLVGSNFQQQVWNELIAIPFGKTMSYLQLARKMNNEKAIRAVATANGANAISILVPCHRIIGSSGEMVGYAGGLSTKKKLLSLENSDHSEQLNLF